MEYGQMDKTVTLKDIDKFIYDWLTTASDLASSMGEVSPMQWVKAQQNAPAPALPYGHWYMKELTMIGHKDKSTTYDGVEESLNTDTLSFYTFSVEVTALGYGSNGLMTIIDQYFNADMFAFNADVAGVGYETHSASQDISAVADAEVREARQFTVRFNCVMKISEVIGIIKNAEVDGNFQNFPILLVNADDAYILNRDGIEIAKSRVEN